MFFPYGKNRWSVSELGIPYPCGRGTSMTATCPFNLLKLNMEAGRRLVDYLQLIE